MKRTRIAVLVSAVAGVLGVFRGHAFEMPADYTHVGWIESDSSGKQWINTGYAPTIGTVITGRFQRKDRVGDWVSLLGAFDVNDDSKRGVLLRFNGNSQNLEGIFCTDYGKVTTSTASGVDYDFVLKHQYFQIGDTVKSYDAANCYDANFTTGAYNKEAFSAPIYVFAECNRNGSGTFDVRRHQPTRFYTLTFAEGTTLMRDFRPGLDADGKPCFWDRVTGQPYYNQATGADFAYGGMTYTKDPLTGAMAVTVGGTLSSEDAEGVLSIAVDLAATDVLEAGVVTALDSLAVNTGTFSLQDGQASTLAVSGAVTLTGGAELKFEVTPEGVDAISAGSVAFAGAGTVKITVRGVGVTVLDADQTLLSGGELTDADLAKFALAAEIPCGLKIANGNLQLTVKTPDAVTWTGTAGNWSTVGNWADDTPPSVGAPVTIDQPAGGTANQDIAYLTIGSLVYAADAGSFTLTGDGLGVSEKIDNQSTAKQTLELPLTLGTAGKTAEIATAGDLALTGELALNGTRTEIAVAEGKTVELGAVSGESALAITGAGTVQLTQDSPAFSGNLEVTGGTLQSLREVPFAEAGIGDEIRVASGGTLVIGPDNAADNAINYKSRQLVISGAGVNGQGAVVYNGAKNQYYAFRTAELAGDATISSTAGRWDVRKQDNVGSFNFNGHTLTKIGAGQFTLSDVKVINGDTPAGLNINEGTVLIENGTSLAGAENTLNVAANGRLQFYQLVPPLGWTVNFAGGAQFDSQDSYADRCILSGPVTLGEGEVTFTVKSETTINGTVTGAGKLKKAGDGSLHLTGGAKTFTGGVDINQGRLYADASDQLPGYDEDKVAITGANAGLVLNSSGWSVDAFEELLNGLSIADASGFVGYAAETETEIARNLGHQNASVWLQGTAAPLTISGNLTFPAGKLTAEGDVTLTGAKTGDFKTAYVYGNKSVLTVKDGYTLLADAGQELRISDHQNALASMVVSNATVRVDPVPASGATSGAIILGYYFNAGAVLEVQDGGLVQHKILGGRYGNAYSSILIREGGRIDNLCGAANDGYIAFDGYGFLENAGTYTMAGYSEVQGANSSGYRNAVGLLYNTGDIESKADTFDLERGGTGVVYQTAGTINVKGGGIQITSQHSGEAGAGIYTIDGPNAVTKTVRMQGNNVNKSLGILNLLNGGTLDYGSLTARENKYVDGGANQPFYLNFAGGFLKPQSSGTLVRDGAQFAPTRVTVFAGGMGVEVGAGLTATLNVPVRAPEGRGIAAITPGADALAKEYIGAPFVQIDGDGYGATAVALFDSTARRITGVKVTSPGCNYTWATASLVYAKETSNASSASLAASVTLTDDHQVYGGLVKRGAGTLVVSQAMLPDKGPLTLEGGVLDLGGATLEVSELTLAGGTYGNGTVVADKVISAVDAFLPRNALSVDGVVEVTGGTLTLDTRDAGLMMTLVKCANQDEVYAVMTNAVPIDWSGAGRVFDFNRANSQLNWGNYQVLAYRGYLWNRGTENVDVTFVEHFDDGTCVLVDGLTVLAFDNEWASHKMGRVTLSPGAHAFEVRFGQLTGGGGPAVTTYKGEWPANTLAFGMCYGGTTSYDVTLYDHLTDISSGEFFTVEGDAAWSMPAALTVAPGAGITFNGAERELVYSSDLVISAEDLAAGRQLTFGNSALTFAPGTTLTVENLEQLDLTGETTTAYVIAECAGGISGLENLEFEPPPKGWGYIIAKGTKLVLAKVNGLIIYIR